MKNKSWANCITTLTWTHCWLNTWLANSITAMAKSIVSCHTHTHVQKARAFKHLLLLDCHCIDSLLSESVGDCDCDCDCDYATAWHSLIANHICCFASLMPIYLQLLPPPAPSQQQQQQLQQMDKCSKDEEEKVVAAVALEWSHQCSLILYACQWQWHFWLINSGHILANWALAQPMLLLNWFRHFFIFLFSPLLL